MDKKDIYEHLAKIYLDASSKRKRKSRKFPDLFKHLFFVSIAFTVSLSLFFALSQHKNNPLNSEIALVLCHDAVKINFNFDPAKKEIYSLNLKGLDLARFKGLAFSVKKENFNDAVSLRVEFNSAFKEKSGTYFRDLSSRWQDYRINFSEFKDISDWSNMANLSFIVEEWNTRAKKGVVYVDNVRLYK